MPQIRIENCNNIKEAALTIELNKLNIVYGANGTGKSTMARVIVEAQSEHPDFTPYTPFNQPNADAPTVTGDHFARIALFNDDYINRYAYQKDSVIKDAFEVFIRTPEYDTAKAEVDAALLGLRTTFSDDADLQTLRTNISNLLGQIKLKQDNTLSKAGGGVKSILSGKGAIFTPPEPLTAMRPFMTDNSIVGWASWRMQGQTDYGHSGLCPFCATTDNESTRAVSTAFVESFDKASVTFASSVKTALEALEGFLAEGKLEELLSLFGAKDRIETLKIKLQKLGVEATSINEKLDRLFNFNASRVDRQNIRELDLLLNSMKMDPAAYDEFFAGPSMHTIIEKINQQIRILIDKVNVLRGAIGKYQATVAKKIQERQQDINDLLASAGFRYRFVIRTADDTQARAILQYVLPDGNESNIDVPSNNLSWGERHAFAMIMFMFDAIRQDADLIILDDPISSFDSSKKYALMHRLFLTRHRDKSLYQRTVLMLTHDFQPIIDYVQVGGRIMDAGSVSAYFCRNHQGTIVFTPIRKNVDIVSTVMLMGEIACDPALDIAVRIGSLRKYIEHTVRDFHATAMYNVLSSLVHGRNTPTHDNRGESPMTPEEIADGVLKIKEYIPDFDYDNILQLCTPANLLSNYTHTVDSYSRIMLLRMYCERVPDARGRLASSNDVLLKYIDETFHIENDYVYMLDVRTFDIVPHHIDVQANEFVRAEMALA